MKNKKRFLFLITAVLVIGLCTACATSSGNGDNEGSNGTNTADDTAEQKQKAEQTIEVLKQLEVTNTIDEINGIAGVEGTKSEYSEEYTWKFNDKNYIMLKYAGDSPILQATVNKDVVKNDAIKLPTTSELQEMLNNGSFTYQQLVEKLGGTEGLLTGKTSSSVSYSWVDKHSNTLRATFNNESGLCTIASIS